MIAKLKVRKAPKTGLGMRSRKFNSLVYLTPEWRGQIVMIIPQQQYRVLMKQARATQLKSQVKDLTSRLRRIRKISL